MPNRSFRDTTRSEKINSISAGAEVFFYRLMMKADDFGNYYGTPKLLRSDLFPLKDGVKEADVAKWVNACIEVGMIVRYTVEGKDYLHIKDFGQRMRFGSKNKFPKYEPTDIQTPPPPAATSGELPPKEQDKEQVEVKDKVKGKKEQAAPLAPPFDSKEFLEKWEILLRQKKWKGKSEDALRENIQFLAAHSEAEAMAIMTKTIAGGWAGLFELNDSEKGKIIGIQGGANHNFPNYWSKKFEGTLPMSDVPKYWQHLRALGLKPKKNSVGETTDWIKEEQVA